ncbi:hypothetical protein HPU229254_09030 [Helicobacter pullorum]|nr:hypothetical protein HPU229254_09030 [Helicobacter pullorum]
MTLPKGLKIWFSKMGDNVAYHAGDSTKREVEANHKRLLESQGFCLEQLVFLNQVHGKEILKANHFGLLGEGDGILIDKKGVVGLIMVADCNPIVIFDSQNKILVMLHAGRLGVEKGIVFEACKVLQEQYGSHFQNLFAYVGPSIRKCCYEVQEEVISEPLMEGKILQNSKIYLDLVAVLKRQFNEMGINHYEISPICTCCDKRYFSYRRDKKCGRFGMFASLE